MDIDADNAMQYRQRAEHIRAIAKGVANPESQELMLKLAEDYENLADTIEKTIGVFPPEIKSKISN